VVFEKKHGFDEAIESGIMNFGFVLKEKIKNAKGENCVAYRGNAQENICDLYTKGNHDEYQSFKMNVADYSIKEEFRDSYEHKFLNKQYILGEISLEIAVVEYDNRQNRGNYKILGSKDNQHLVGISKKKTNKYWKTKIAREYYENCLLTIERPNSKSDYIIQDYDEIKQGSVPILGLPLYEHIKEFNIPYYVTLDGLVYPSFCYILRGKNMFSNYDDNDANETLENDIKLVDYVWDNMKACSLFYPEIRFSLEKAMDIVNDMLYTKKSLRVDSIEQFASMELMFEICTKPTDEPYLVDRGVDNRGAKYPDDLFYSPNGTYGTDCEDGAVLAYSTKKLISDTDWGAISRRLENTRRSTRATKARKIGKTISFLYKQFSAFVCVLLCDEDNIYTRSATKYVFKRGSTSRNRSSSSHSSSEKQRKSRGGEPICHVVCILIPNDFMSDKRRNIFNNHLIILETTAKINPMQNGNALSDSVVNILKIRENAESIYEKNIAKPISHIKSSIYYIEEESWYSCIVDMWSDDYRSTSESSLHCYVMGLQKNNRKFWGISIKHLIGLIDREETIVSLNFSFRKRMSFENRNNEKEALNVYFSAHMGPYQIVPKEKHTSNLTITLEKSKSTYSGHVAIGYSIFHSMYSTEYRGESQKLYNLLVQDLKRRGMDETGKKLWRILIKSVNEKNNGTMLENIIKHMSGEPTDNLKNFIRVTVFSGLFNSSDSSFSSSRMKYIVDDLMRITKSANIKRKGDSKRMFHTIVPIICDPLKGRMFTKFSFLVFYNSSI